jgi:hypothetical protein
MRYFETVFIKKGDIQDGFEFFIAVMPDVCEAPAGFQKRITLLPYTQGMGFDTGKV